MLEKLKQFVSDLTGDRSEPSKFDENDHRLAAAALLVHAIAIDGFVEEHEKAAVNDVLKRQFSLSEEETRELVEEAIIKDLEAVDLYGFTSVIKRSFDQEGRQAMVEMLWEIVYADGNVHEFEDNLVWRVAELLGVSTRDRMRLKAKVRKTLQ